jgi:DNA-binding MarR family transcriptional regulator
MFNLDDCFALIISRSGKVFAEALEKDLKPHNITRPQWIAMYYIYDSTTLTQKQLADKMATKELTVVRLLQKLEYEGMVRRETSKEDKRVNFIYLTESGTKLCVKLTPIVEKFKDNIIRGISLDDLEILKRSLDKMVENATNDV